MMDRRTFLSGITLEVLSAPLAAAAQQVRTPRIGALNGGVPFPHLDAAFVQGLRELGWHEGQNILIEWRHAHGASDKLPELVAELMRLKVDLFVSFHNPATTAIKRATATIPIVMRFAIDPIGQGYVKSLAQPGGNITGVAWDSNPDIAAKYLELLKQIAPHISRAAGLIDPTYPGIDAYRTRATNAAPRLGLVLQHVEVRRREDLRGAIEVMKRERAQAIFVYGSAWMFATRREMAELATKHGLPAIFIWREAVEAGGLISYGTNLQDLHRRAAYFVDKILKGAKPGDLPVDQAQKFELVINLKTAKALGLTIPPSLLARADQVIE
jgi:putative tryptophan/tyrosine transport system substrate-binding protein